MSSLILIKEAEETAEEKENRAAREVALSMEEEENQLDTTDKEEGRSSDHGPLDKEEDEECTTKRPRTVEEGRGEGWARNRSSPAGPVGTAGGLGSSRSSVGTSGMSRAPGALAPSPGNREIGEECVRCATRRKKYIEVLMGKFR